MSKVQIKRVTDTLRLSSAHNTPPRETALHSLVSEDVSILVGVEGQFEDAVHNAALDSHLGVLQLVLARVLPNGIAGHGTVQVAQKILHRCRLVIRCCAPLERWRGEQRDSRCNTGTRPPMCNLHCATIGLTEERGDLKAQTKRRNKALLINLTKCGDI